MLNEKVVSQNALKTLTHAYNECGLLLNRFSAVLVGVKITKL